MARAATHDSPFGWVPDLMGNVFNVGYTVAVGIGATFNDVAESIHRSMETADAITPTDTTAAIRLLGFDPLAIFQI